MSVLFVTIALQRPKLAALEKRYNMSNVEVNLKILELNVYEETLN